MNKKKLCTIYVFLLLPFLVVAQTKAITYGNNANAGKYVSTRGIRLYYEIYGKGEPLLLIHGNSGSIAHFKYQIPYFERLYKVIAVDSRAQGKSVDTSAILNYEMMADDLNALLDSLHLDSVNVIGWSDGGINGLLLAIRHPQKVKKLVACGANLVPDSSVFTAASAITQYVSSLRAQKQDAAMRNAFKVAHIMEVEPQIPLTDLQKIACPVFVIGGDNDLIRPSHTLQIFENIPKAQLWIAPASGHGVLHHYKEEFNTKVKDFLSRPYTKTNWADWD